jgi:hypothetical protein
LVVFLVPNENFGYEVLSLLRSSLIAQSRTRRLESRRKKKRRKQGVGFDVLLLEVVSTSKREGA